jgi:hypothetical protein
MSVLCTSVASNEREVPPTVNEVEEDTRRGTIFSDRKASKFLGITVLRAPGLTIDQKASKILGTAVVMSGTDWETRVNGESVDPRSQLRKGFFRTKVTPLMLGKGEGERVTGKEGEKVVLSPKWKSARVYKSGPNQLLPQAPSSSKWRTERLDSTTETYAEAPQEDGGEWSDLGLDPEAVPDDTVSDTATLVEDLGIDPLSVPNSCPPISIDPPTHPEPYGMPVSPTARRNPVLQKRREMIRSANKSVQILGVEARRAILRKTEKENKGRIGWSGV